ncbi:MAG: site-specific integrase [Bacteroides sp.]|nr:site-specific integrase [Bacteroides sp.]MCM1413086.1 site-specific integrase [Bacteroides sp.]MCM1472172.1 site-specific integrase [Bacteroides sp.]
MNKKFRVSFYLRSKINKDGKSSVLTRLYLNSERVIIGSAGFNVDAKLWDANLGRMKGRSAEANKVNEGLNRIELDLMHLFRRYEFSDALSLDLIKAEYLGVNNTNDSFIAFFDNFLKQVKEEVGITRATASYQKFSVLKKHFTAYIYEEYKRRDLLMGELSYKIISGFEHYLLTTGKCQHNTVMRMMGNLKTITIRAFKSGLLKQDPYANYKIQFNKTDRGFLSEAEIQTMMSKEFAIPRLEVVRDIFIFSCFTGLAYIDVAQLMPENIVEVNGRKWIMTKRQKTNVPSNVLLLDVAEAILKKYKGQDPKGRLLPIFSNQKMNSYLKEIADLCGITKKLTFHLARHTFATLAISKGVPIESVSRMLGHTKIATTQIYAKILNTKIEADMLNFANNLHFNTDAI